MAISRLMMRSITARMTMFASSAERITRWDHVPTLPKPYYENPALGVTLYHADNRDVLPYLHGDLVLTDPPYGNGTGYDGYDDTRDSLRGLVADVIPLCRQAAPVSMVFCGNGNQWLYPEPTWTLCWFYGAGVHRSPWGFNCWQPILAYGADPYLKEGKGCRPDALDKIETPKGNFDHPCPKPIGLMRWMIMRGTTQTGQTVIDPFAGSGSTLRAAMDCGRKVIGIEQSLAYCDVIAERMSQMVMPLGV